MDFRLSGQKLLSDKFLGGQNTNLCPFYYYGYGFLGGQLPTLQLPDWLKLLLSNHLHFLYAVRRSVSGQVWVTNGKFHHDMNGKKGMLYHGQGQFVMSCCFSTGTHRKKSVRIPEPSKKTLITLRWLFTTALNLCVLEKPARPRRRAAFYFRENFPDQA